LHMFVLTLDGLHVEVLGTEPHHQDVICYVLFSTEVDANRGSAQWFFEYLARLIENTMAQEPSNVMLVNDKKRIVI